MIINDKRILTMEMVTKIEDVESTVNEKSNIKKVVGAAMAGTIEK